MLFLESFALKISEYESESMVKHFEISHFPNVFKKQSAGQALEIFCIRFWINPFQHPAKFDLSESDNF